VRASTRSTTSSVGDYLASEGPRHTPTTVIGLRDRARPAPPLTRPARRSEIFALRPHRGDRRRLAPGAFVAQNRIVRLPQCTPSQRLPCAADGRSRRKARVADRGLGRRKRADSAPTRIALGRTVVRAEAAIPLRAQNRPVPIAAVPVCLSSARKTEVPGSTTALC
jgi:hypothetical protein